MVTGTSLIEAILLQRAEEDRDAVLREGKSEMARMLKASGLSAPSVETEKLLSKKARA